MFIGAYWDARKETLDESAERIKSALKALANVDKRFSEWYLKGRTRNSSSDRAITADMHSVAALLRTNNRDDDGSAIEELGFSVGLWNGDDFFPCSFSATCGAYSNYFKNSVVLEFPTDCDVLSELSEGAIRNALIGIVNAFDPEVAVLTSNDFIDRFGGGAPWDAGGWLLYRREDGIAKLKVIEPVGVLS